MLKKARLYKAKPSCTNAKQLKLRSTMINRRQIATRLETPTMMTMKREKRKVRMNTTTRWTMAMS